MRYLSADPTKNLTLAEAKSLAAEGIWVGVVWETTADRMLSGRPGGIADAKAALAQARECGMPEDRPIYFAADFDVTPEQQGPVNAYLFGAASVLGAARVGVYGGYYTVKRALDRGAARWAWQASAWSGGQWDPRAHIQQPIDTVTIGGVECDRDTAMTSDFGQWMPGLSPEDDMPLTTDDINKIALAVNAYKNPSTGPDLWAKVGDIHKAVVERSIPSLVDGAAHSLGEHERATNAAALATRAEVAELSQKVDKLATTLAAIAKKVGA
ncbi:protein of unknown function [Streptantibioticus cattleyicolor NRRL 8057 = DSM 46488]|nr:protein of unknown function [Streptantibioticus cattleyicolor NRRL 8057 = DSM 46488]CCB74943.1 protein of unknown function [Streptantibioticus cattleyicolor NRRL 8057 = DSM 46488]